MIVFVNYENFEEQVIHNEGLILADFYSESCVPCKMLSPILYALDERYEGKIKIVKIKAGTNFELTEKYNVTSTPTVLFLRNGRELERLTGFADTETWEEIINRYL